MGKATLLAFVAVLGLVCLQSADGLKCHSCGYFSDSSLGESNDKCEKKPDSPIECTLDARIPTASNQSLTVADLIPKGMSLDRDFKFACGKISAKGKTINGKSDVKTVVRTCFASFTDVKAGCTDKSGKEWFENVDTDGLSAAASLISILYEDNTQITGCACTDDKCNSANGLNFSFAILLASIVLTVFKLQW